MQQLPCSTATEQKQTQSSILENLAVKYHEKSGAPEQLIVQGSDRLRGDFKDERIG
jgi:hypothetical protein